MPARLKRPSASSAKKPLAQKAGGSGVPTDDDLKALVPKGMAATFVKSKLHDKSLAVAGLGEPSDWDGDMPELPNDIAGTDHGTLSNLLAQFTNAMSSSLWAASKAYIEADAYEEIAEYLRNQALLHSNESNDTKRRADAETDDSYVAARAMQKARYHDYVRHRDLSDTLRKRAAVVSRVGGFVGDEADIEEMRSGKLSTRGKAAGSSKGSSRGQMKLKAKR